MLRGLMPVLPTSLRPLVLLLLAGLMTPAPAWELTPFAARQWGGDFRDERNDLDLEFVESSAYGVTLNWRHGPDTDYEIYYALQPTEIRAEGSDPTAPRFDVDVHYLHIGGLYLGDGPTLRPYLAATAGLTHLRPRGAGLESETRLSAALGVGAKWALGEHFGLRGELRYLATFTDSSAAIFCSGGCEIAVAGTGFGQVQASLGVILRF
jgi:hypothetical protein